jgi:hypothetical protein
LTYPNGNRFEGTVEQFAENGSGVYYIKKSGDQIICRTWSNGYANGEMEYVWCNGNRMRAEYDNGKMKDNSIVRYEDCHGFSFEAEFKNDYPVIPSEVLPKVRNPCHFILVVD